MVRKKIDNRVRLLIENGVAEGKRSMFVVVGDKARDQVGSSLAMLVCKGCPKIMIPWLLI